MITVAIASPVPALRAGLRALISADPELSVAGVASSLAGPELIDAAEAGWVIVVTPGGIADMEALPPGAAVLLVSEEEEEAAALAARMLSAQEPRAWGVVSPEASAEALQAAVRALAEGLVVVEPGVYARLQDLSAPPAEPEEEDGPIDHLTRREIEVLQAIAKGLSNKQIALALHISEHTVKFHVSSLYSKLGVSSRTEAMRKGARLGYVPL